MKRFLIVLYLFSAAAGASLAAAPEGAQSARQTIAEWAQTQRVLSQEASRWRQEKEVLNQSILLLEKESDLLAARLGELEAEGRQTEGERQAVDREAEALAAAAAEAEELVAGLEEELNGLRAVLPPPLQARAAPLLARLDQAGGQPANLGQRLQTVLGILGEVNRFQRNVTLSRETRALTDGTQREMQTIYLGLGQAFFVDDNRQIAGTGRPVRDGWEWTRNDDIAASVGRAVAILQKERTAEFVRLPVEVEP